MVLDMDMGDMDPGPICTTSHLLAFVLAFAVFYSSLIEIDIPMYALSPHVLHQNFNICDKSTPWLPLCNELPYSRQHTGVCSLPSYIGTTPLMLYREHTVILALPS